MPAAGARGGAGEEQEEQGEQGEVRAVRRDLSGLMDMSAAVEGFFGRSGNGSQPAQQQQQQQQQSGGSWGHGASRVGSVVSSSHHRSAAAAASSSDAAAAGGGWRSPLDPVADDMGPTSAPDIVSPVPQRFDPFGRSPSSAARGPEGSWIGAAAVASLLAAVLTEIYLCGVRSCQEILRRNGRDQRAKSASPAHTGRLLPSSGTAAAAGWGARLAAPRRPAPRCPMGGWCGQATP
jgi:hypothetical protein